MLKTILELDMEILHRPLDFAVPFGTTSKIFSIRDTRA